MVERQRVSVSVVIPTFNRKEKLLRLIGSLLKSTYPITEPDIIVVNDRSTDGTADAVTEAFPGIKLINNDEEGFISHSRNIGIRAASGDYVLLIDDDNVIDPDCVGELVGTFLNDGTGSIGIVGPMMCYLNQPEVIWCAGVHRSMVTSLTSFVGRGEVDWGQYRGLIESNDFPNAFMMTREAIDRVGLFDEALFPIHYEEADVGERTRRAGLRVVCNPLAKTWHDIPMPSKQDDKTRTYHLQNDTRAYYSGRNRVLFFKKYSGPIGYLLFISIFNWPLTAYYLNIIRSARARTREEKKRLSRSYVRGVLDGLRMKVASR